MAAGRHSWRMASTVIDPRERKLVVRSRYWRIQDLINAGLYIACFAIAILLAVASW